MPFGWGNKDKPVVTDPGPLDAFEAALPPDPGSVGPVSGWSDKDTRSLLGSDVPLFTLFMAERVRSSVGGGLLRFLLPRSQPSITEWNKPGGWRSDWPSVPPGVVFASDWTGRLYLFSGSRPLPNGEPSIALLDPATAEAEPLDLTLGEFLGNALARSWCDLLGADRLDAWRATGGLAPAANQCVSPKVPLFLGGSTEVGDLEVSPLVVAVSLAGQMWQQVKDLPAGAPISGITIR